LEVSRDTREAELKTMAGIFADAETTDEVLAFLSAGGAQIFDPAAD
jgi:hypothetical protein